MSERFTEVLKPQKGCQNSNKNDSYWVVVAAAVQMSVLPTCPSKHWNSRYIDKLCLFKFIFI